MEVQRSSSEIKAVIKERYDLIWYKNFKNLEENGDIVGDTNYEAWEIDRDRARAERIEKHYEELHGNPIELAGCLPKIWGEVHSLMWILGREHNAKENCDPSEIKLFYNQEAKSEIEKGFTWIYGENGHTIIGHVKPIKDV